MLDAALIKECANPSLKPAIVEQFVQAVGSDDPLRRRSMKKNRVKQGFFLPCD
jgi:hypothetical protein